MKLKSPRTNRIENVNIVVTVIMPARNEQRYIGAAIESIIKQTYKFWELIIVDDNSKDDTKKIALEYASNDKRIRVINGDGICSGNARNKAIELAAGKYIMNMDADDYSDPRRIEKLLNVASKNEYSVVGSNLAYVSERMEVKRVSNLPQSNKQIRKGFERSFNRRMIYPQTIMATTNLFKKYRYDEKYKVMVDWDLILRLGENKSVHFENAKEALYFYRLNDGSMSIQQTKRIRYNLFLRFNEIQRNRGYPEFVNIEDFEVTMGTTLKYRLIYSMFFLMKRIQHSCFLLRKKMLLG